MIQFVWMRYRFFASKVSRPHGVGPGVDGDQEQRKADEARDSRAWLRAESHYAVAIDVCRRLTPERAAALSVQRGHCLKEAHRFEEAELCYRDAMALGAGTETIEHLAFTARRAAWTEDIYPPEVVEADYRSLTASRQLLTRWDVRAVLALLLENASLADAALLGWLRRAPTLDRLVTAVIKDARFVSSNARLLSAAARDAGRA